MPVQKYVKKPIVIEAVQWTGENLSELKEFVLSQGLNLAVNESDKIGIETLEGTMFASPGDYIIKEPNPTADRRFYPCKPDIFEKTYDTEGGGELFVVQAFERDGEPCCSSFHWSEPAALRLMELVAWEQADHSMTCVYSYRLPRDKVDLAVLVSGMVRGEFPMPERMIGSLNGPHPWEQQFPAETAEEGKQE